jgi:transposase
MQSEETWMDLRALHRQGWTVSALARRFRLNRRTVRRDIAAERPRRYPDRPTRHPLTEAQLAHVARRLGVCPTLRTTDLHRELQKDYAYAGSYTTLRRALLLVRVTQPSEPEVRFETPPGKQTQADWKHLGLWPLGDEMVELHAMVAVLGHSRAPAMRIATNCTREVTFERLLRCLDDLGGVTSEILIDRDPAFCNNSGVGPLFVPEWVDLCDLVGIRPRACKPRRAKTKGKVERVNREIEESFRAWLTGQVLPLRPTIADYDALAAQWIAEVMLPRRHRTTKRIVGEAWAEERPVLAPIPRHLLQRYAGDGSAAAVLRVVDLGARHLGEHVEIRDLSEYEVVV